VVYIGASLSLNLHQMHIVSILLILDGFGFLGLGFAAFSTIHLDAHAGTVA
jgi:hypothetical protein